MSGELWLAEGFTNYYGPLVLKRAGLYTLDDFAREMGTALNTVLTSPGRQVRSAVEMSQFAPLSDGARAADPTNFDNTVISYYTWGQAIALGLDLTLRDRSNGRVTLDDFMRAMWVRHGKPAAQAVVQGTAGIRTASGARRGQRRVRHRRGTERASRRERPAHLHVTATERVVYLGTSTARESNASQRA